VILSSGFVADCLETLEELGMRAAADFRAHGGQLLRLVPSLNATPDWADAVVTMAREASAWLAPAAPTHA
jgi:ferrochelatase